MASNGLHSVVSEKLQAGHKIVSVVEAGLVEEFVRNTRIIALVQSASTDASSNLFCLLIFQTSRIPVYDSSDLKLEWALPIDTYFKCQADSPTTEDSTEDLVTLSYKTHRLLIEMPSGHKVNQLVSDIHKAMNVLSKKKGAPHEYHWFENYAENSLHNLNEKLESTVQQSVEFGVEVLSLNETTKMKDNLGLNKPNVGLSPTPITARETHINYAMALHEEQYMNINNYSVFIGTWNVNGQYPSVGLAEWMAVDEKPPDIYAIGFQELDLNKEAFLFSYTPREQEWLNAVLNGVHPKAKYKKVRLIRLVGMMLVILVQEQHFAYVSNIAVNTVGTGIMNKLGNKGGVSIRMELYHTSICFVNVHMAAHQDEYERRNEDHDCILQRTVFNTSIQGPPKQIKDHDHIYFFGDMNYRVNPGRYDIKELASKGQFKTLLDNDQLLIYKKSRRIFNDFTEAEIGFKPTYKYNLNTNDWYDGEKTRLPSWCDRILWTGNRIRNLSYRSHPSLRISDHKPVSALFEAGLKEMDLKRYNKIYEEVMKKLDKLENEFLPQVVVDNNEIIFEPVKFLQSQTKTINIENTGQVPVCYKFIKKLDELNYCKPWLNIHPEQGFLKPGEKSKISLEVLVDKRTASKLNCGSEQLYDILVLHLEHGKDIFITVTGDYERSSFGASINALVNIRRPFKDVPMSQLLDLESPKPNNVEESPYGIPKEFWYFIDYLYSKAMLVEGLFTTSGLMKEIGEIRSSLDAGVPSATLPGGPHSVADALLLFLDALREPVIPYAMYDRALEATPNFALCQQVISELPSYHRNVFTHLMAFLKELLTYTEDNLCDAKTLALVFGPVLLRNPKHIVSGLNCQSLPEERKKQTFIHHFLVNE